MTSELVVWFWHPQYGPKAIGKASGIPTIHVTKQDTFNEIMTKPSLYKCVEQREQLVAELRALRYEEPSVKRSERATEIQRQLGATRW